MLCDLRDVEPLSGQWIDLSSNCFSDVLLDCYIPISKTELNQLRQNKSSFFVSPDNETVITYSTQGRSFVVIPLKEKYANEILNLQS